MTAQPPPGSDGNATTGDGASRPVFVELGQRPGEKGRIGRPGDREAYPADVRARLDLDAKEIIGRYPHSRSALLSLLHLVQAEDGYITPAGIEFCCAQLELSGAEVAAVATFYSMYRREPTGDYHVGVCTNTLCAVMGGDAILAALQEHLELDHGSDTTGDGKITLEHIECNAACDYAPVVMVNWEFFDNQTPDSARALVDALQAGKSITPSRGAPLCTFRQTARILAGFPDQRAGAVAAAGSGGEATLVGLRIARERDMSAPPIPDPLPPATPEPNATESVAAQSVADKPAPGPSATVPAAASTSETNPEATDGHKGD